MEPGQVGLTFLGHASFLIESPAGVTAVTDYSGAYVPERVPDIVTMNHAHISHYTDTPDPEIKYVLRGWDPNGGKAEINLTYKDVHIRNVPTNIRDFSGGTIYNGNSIFIFEVGSLCIAHLGHIHHELLPTHLEAMGPIDVVMVPVDGAYTIDQPGMIKIMQSIGAPLAIPMHFFGPSTLARFIDIASKDYKIVMSERRPCRAVARDAPQGADPPGPARPLSRRLPSHRVASPVCRLAEPHLTGLFRVGSVAGALNRRIVNPVSRGDAHDQDDPHWDRARSAAVRRPAELRRAGFGGRVRPSWRPGRSGRPELQP